MSCERSRGQPGTIEIGLVEPPEWNAPGSHDGFACEHSVAAVAVLIDVAAAHHAKLVAMSLPPWTMRRRYDIRTGSFVGHTVGGLPPIGSVVRLASVRAESVACEGIPL